MVTYGPWTQDPDYVRNAAVGGSQGSWVNQVGPRLVSGAGGHGERTETHAEYVPVDDAWISAVWSEAQGNSSGGWYGFNMSGNRGYRGWTQGTIGQLNWVSGGYADTNYLPWPVGAREGYWPSVWPAGAVDIEFQDGEYSQMLDLWVDGSTSLRSRDVDWTENEAKPIAGAYRTDIWAAPSAPGSTWGYPMSGAVLLGSKSIGIGGLFVDGVTMGTTTLDSSLHLAPHLDPNGGAWVWATSTWVASREGGVEIRPSNFGVEWEWGAVIGRLGLTYTYRPPVYRFIFDEVTVARQPPRRIFPRDDGLTGGARRTWPPSKGYQYGNRVDGSGYL